MKKLLTFILIAILGFGMAVAQEKDAKTVKVYCEVTCVQYNLLKGDVNARVDFGIAEKASDCNGWIYNSENKKRLSFASRMGVLSFMSRHGWEYRDALIVMDDSDSKNCWHFILSKEVPADYTAKDVIGDINYRTH